MHIKEDTARKLPERGILKIPPEEIAWKDPEAVFCPMPNQPTPGNHVHVIFKPSDLAMTTVEMGLLCTANPPYLIWIDRILKWVVHYDTAAFRRASSASIPLPWVDNAPVGCIPTIKWQHLITIPVHLRNSFPPSAVNNHRRPTGDRVVTITPEISTNGSRPRGNFSGRPHYSFRARFPPSLPPRLPPSQLNLSKLRHWRVPGHQTDFHPDI